MHRKGNIVVFRISQAPQTWWSNRAGFENLLETCFIRLCKNCVALSCNVTSIRNIFSGHQLALSIQIHSAISWALNRWLLKYRSPAHWALIAPAHVIGALGDAPMYVGALQIRLTICSPSRILSHVAQGSENHVLGVFIVCFGPQDRNEKNSRMLFICFDATPLSLSKGREHFTQQWTQIW